MLLLQNPKERSCRHLLPPTLPEVNLIASFSFLCYLQRNSRPRAHPEQLPRDIPHQHQHVLTSCLSSMHWSVPSPGTSLQDLVSESNSVLPSPLRQPEGRTSLGPRCLSFSHTCLPGISTKWLTFHISVGRESDCSQTTS